MTILRESALQPSKEFKSRVQLISPTPATTTFQPSFSTLTKSPEFQVAQLLTSTSQRLPSKHTHSILFCLYSTVEKQLHFVVSYTFKSGLQFPEQFHSCPSATSSSSS